MADQKDIVKDVVQVKLSAPVPRRDFRLFVVRSYPHASRGWLAFVTVKRRSDLSLRLGLRDAVGPELRVTALANADRRKWWLHDPESTWLHVRQNPNNFAVLPYPQATSR